MQHKPKEKKPKELWQKIRDNPRLANWEIWGFKRGAEKGKTMSVSAIDIFLSLQKQWQDLLKSYALYGLGKGNEDLQRRIADLRNVAGCLFLKVEGEE